MKNILLFLIFLVLLSCSSQKMTSGKTELGFATTENDSLKSEIKYFIESKVSELELVKILPKCETRGHPVFNEDETEIIGRETVEYCDYETIISKKTSGLKKNAVDLKKEYIGQKVQLKKSDYLKIFKILYEKDTSEYEEEVVISDCYLPRHGLGFYDAKKSLIGFLEICFECNRYKIAGEIPQYNLLLETELTALKRIYEEYNLGEK